MQEAGLSIVPLPTGSGGASTSGAQVAVITSKGNSSAGDQGTCLLSRGGASTSLGQVVPLHTRGGMPASAFQVASSTSRPLASTSRFQGAVYASRLKFYVELKEGETNVVSWKKLVKDAQKNAPVVVSEAPAGANPALEARFAPERVGLVQTNMEAVQEAVPPPPSRFSSVIEKIERLYKGVDSEEEDVGALVDVSQYGSDDSFIDDTELNEYFSVEKAKTKHTGFFVNRGKLEKVSESPPPSPVHVPRKRKRKDVSKPSGQIACEEFAKKRVNSGLRLKNAARKTSVPCLTAGVEASPSTLLRTSEQSLVSKPKKRAKPLLDGDKNVELTSRLTHHQWLEENLGHTSKVEEIKDSVGKVQTTVVELSDDKSDAVKDYRTQLNGKEQGISDNLLPKKQAPKQSESAGACADERINITKSIKEFTEEKSMREVLKETRIVALPKVRKNQLTKDEESRETEGSGKSLSGFLTLSPGPKELSPKKSAGWPKGTVLERAIHDLERGVAEVFPLTGDRQAAIEKAEAGGKSKRLPREIKQKLAKVARLAAKKGKISDELIDRLMNIIGHVMRLKTLKRNLKSMVEMGLNAKQEKDVRLQTMKHEVTELVKSRVSTFLALDSEQREGSSDDFQATPGSTDRSNINGRYKWDQTTEDRICDLYDHYVEGMDEHKGPHIRKLYMELAELWPDGWMDNHGIKSAVFRAKERKKKQNKLKMGEEKRRRKVTVVNDKQKGDITERRLHCAAPSALVPAVVKGVPTTKTVGLPTKEKLTIKSSKQRMDCTSDRPHEPITTREEGPVPYVEEEEEEEEARRLAIEVASRHGVELTRPLAVAGSLRENAISISLVEVNSILKDDDSVKVKRTEDGAKVKRKLPRKSFEGKIVEHAVRKNSRNVSIESDSLETRRSMKDSSLNSPLLKSKKKKLRPPLDAKSPLRVNASQMKVLGNGVYPSRLGDISPLEGAEFSPRMGADSDRIKDVARWQSQTLSQLMEE